MAFSVKLVSLVGLATAGDASCAESGVANVTGAIVAVAIAIAAADVILMADVPV
ncbi:hypothetical protein GCM10023115_06900 [Pontixanthobacter gangjinensis]